MTIIRRTLLLLVMAMVASSAMAQGGPPAAPQGTARITGTIARVDGRPIPNATIRWVRWEGGRGTQGSGRAEADGKFILDRLVAGSYQITAQSEGFVTSDYGQTVAGQPGKRIDVIDGQVFEHADVVLQKTSAIEGQLLDEFGDPVPGATVQLAQVQFVAGKTRLMPAPGQAPQPSDDRGHYRVSGLAPGDYYVMVLSGAFAVPETSAGFAPTFYPGTATPTDAKSVHLVAGQDVLDVGFALTPATMRSVRGVTLAADGTPTSAMVLLAQTSGGDVRAMILARGQSAPDGSFEFRSVPEGSYVVQAFGRPEGGGSVATSPFAAAQLTVAGNTPEVRLSVRPGSIARGRFVFEGDGSALKPSMLLLSGAPTEFLTSPLIGGGPPRNTILDDWTFEVRDMIGLRVVRASIAAPGWFVKSVVVAGQDVTDTGIDFRRGDVSDIEITLTQKQSSITGTVTDGDTPSREYSVLVFAEDAAKWAFPSRFVALARPAPADGSFRAAGLPAAAYLVVALSLVTTADMQDPVFLQSMRGQATRVVLNEGDTKAVALRIIKR